jgi:hypothetical protein
MAGEKAHNPGLDADFYRNRLHYLSADAAGRQDRPHRTGPEAGFSSTSGPTKTASFPSSPRM